MSSELNSKSNTWTFSCTLWAVDALGITPRGEEGGNILFQPTPLVIVLMTLYQNLHIKYTYESSYTHWSHTLVTYQFPAARPISKVAVLGSSCNQQPS